MKKILLFCIASTLFACKGDPEKNSTSTKSSSTQDTIQKEDPQNEEGGFFTDEDNDDAEIKLSLENANKLAALPLKCIGQQYPNKLGQTLENKEALGEPKQLHPAFYGCFDWHSSVHGHWSLVSLIKQFPDLEKSEEIRNILKNSLSKENIAGEVSYFKRPESDSYERTYGWAWLLKLSEELKTWNDSLGKDLYKNLQPLTQLVVQRFEEFLPKLTYPIRVGEHSNTAFALSFAYDYAKTEQNKELEDLISARAKDFYLNDNNCPLSWEPGGYDFLSPCLEEIDIMRKILPKNAFQLWIQDFMPQLTKDDFSLEVAEVSDRTDGKLVHLDGLNFSRAWVLYGLAKEYPDLFPHLNSLANKHVAYSFPNLIGDSYEGGHWLGSFAIYALQQAEKN